MVKGLSTREATGFEESLVMGGGGKTNNIGNLFDLSCAGQSQLSAILWASEPLQHRLSLGSYNNIIADLCHLE